MKIESLSWNWPDEQEVCSVDHLSKVSGLSNEELNDLIDNEVILPVDDKANPLLFRTHYLIIAATGRRLRDDFELEPHGITLALTLIRRIDEIQEELNAFRAQHGNGP